MRRAKRIVAAARGLIGVPFRLHGRSAETGVDCIGLCALAFAAAGNRRALDLAPATYSVRGGRPEMVCAALRSAGLRSVRAARPGDIIVATAGVAQFHLMVATDGGHVHAHAGLGLVVEMPGASPWPILGRWRWGR